MSCPTEFSREPSSLAQTLLRKETTELLWRWAEGLKIELGRNSPAKVPLDGELGRNLIRNLEAQQSKINDRAADPGRIASVIREISLYREEIDVQISEPLNESIEYANRMIAAKLGRGGSLSREVERVYIVGNASRYPLVTERIASQLDIPFIAHRTPHVSDDDLKNSVAKGAALALRLFAQVLNVQVEFDQTVSRKLPFDVTFWDHRRGSFRALFQEHENYDELTPLMLPVPDMGGSERDRQHKDVFLGPKQA